MPCRGEDDDYPRIDPEDLTKLRNIESLMCAMLSLLEVNMQARFNFVLANINYKEAGVSRKWLEKWWAQHKAEDAKRRECERKEAERKKHKANGLKKLTPKEREALGLNHPRDDSDESDESDEEGINYL